MSRRSEVCGRDRSAGRRWSRLALLALVSAMAPACVRGSAVQSLPSLRLRRVVVYRNGVAYFERAGHVGGDNVEFRVRQREVATFSRRSL
jgi:hypothetical protein